jgi:carboxypeptidase Taq
LDALIAKGEFKPLREWLRRNIHLAGSLLPSAHELCEKVTGRGLDGEGFVRHLTQKYSEIYGFQ